MTTFYKSIVPGAVELAIVSQSGAIGFSSIALRSAGTRPLAVARGNTQKVVTPDIGTISSKCFR